MFGWLKRRRRARLLSEPFPEEWQDSLERDVALWRVVPDALRPKLEDDMRIFLAERQWEACGGLVLTEAMGATIAAQACLLTLGRSVDAYSHVRSILVYPDRYLAPDSMEDDAGVVTEGLDDREGEACERGLVVLSWADLRQDARRADGRNLVLHEFAHQLDLLDFLGAGLFSAGDRERHGRWRQVLDEAYDALSRLDDEGRKDKVLDTYGAEDPSEFFAVATEACFERPAALQKHHPNLYGVLAEYFNLDPASWNWAAVESLQRERDRAESAGRNPKKLRRRAKRTGSP